MGMNAFQAAFLRILLESVLQRARLHIVLCSGKEICIVPAYEPAAKRSVIIVQWNGTDRFLAFGRSDHNMGLAATVCRRIMQPLECSGNMDRVRLQVNVAPFQSTQFTDAHTGDQHK